MNSQDFADARDAIQAAHNERIWQALLDDIRASGLTPAAARRRWESQPGLVEACEAMLGDNLPGGGKPGHIDFSQAVRMARAALAAAKEPNNE